MGHDTVRGAYQMAFGESKIVDLDTDKRIAALLSAMELMHEQNKGRDRAIDGLIESAKLGMERQRRLEELVENYIKRIRNGGAH